MRRRTLQLVEELQREQDRLLEMSFVAPCSPGSRGEIRVRVGCFHCCFQAELGDFVGWGLFQAESDRRARLQREADRSEIELYLKACQSLEMRLLSPLGDCTWLAYPIHGSGAIPALVHLVENGQPTWQACQVGWDGRNYWYAGLAPKADPRMGESLQRALRDATPPSQLRLAGLTPLDRQAYSVEFLRLQIPDRPEQALERALARGGGRLGSYIDQGQSWLVQWQDSLGEQHSSRIRKDNLGVLSAGVCLSGEDEKFDLTSLVGVVEGFEL